MFLPEATLSNPGTMRVLIVDDNQAFAESLAHYLERQVDIDAVEIAASSNEAAVIVELREPAVVLMDYGLGTSSTSDGVDATRAIKKVRPDVGVVIITGHDDRRRLMQALDAGAIGWISKSQGLEEILFAVRAAAVGRTTISSSDPTMLLRDVPDRGTRSLSGREVEILRWIAEGKTTKWIAGQTFLSEHTVRNHVRHIFTKLKVHSRLEAVAEAQHIGVLDDRRAR